MRSIDIHAHLEPQCFQKAMREGKTWHGITADDDEADLDPMEVGSGSSVGLAQDPGPSNRIKKSGTRSLTFQQSRCATSSVTNK